MKTLGQIALAGFTERVDKGMEGAWEASAQAVRQAVIEECLTAMDNVAHLSDSPVSDMFEEVRALKEKK